MGLLRPARVFVHHTLFLTCVKQALSPGLDFSDKGQGIDLRQGQYRLNLITFRVHHNIYLHQLTFTC